MGWISDTFHAEPEAKHLCPGEQSGLSEILPVMQEARISRDRCASLSVQRPADGVCGADEYMQRSVEIAGTVALRPDSGHAISTLPV